MLTSSFAAAQKGELMDISVSGLAEMALRAKSAMLHQELSVAMVKQNLQMDQAIVQLLTQATDQVAAATRAASSGHTVDILV
jgi:c-di-GMP-binding flagellar brake protein YcgR